VRRTIVRLSHRNITIFGYLGSNRMTHAKLLVVDDRVATFGSFNLFDLEGLTQKELNVFTRDRALIDGFRALVTRDIASSRVVAAPRRTFGRFTYSLIRQLFASWTRRLLRDPGWRAKYG
jgi:phosphatidylserine/phosphatidylglycerophosphate/cardiolipin synthase-like enzyme